MIKMSKAYKTLKIEENLLDEVKSIAKNKFPLRNIDSYAEATREALIEFAKKIKNISSTTPHQIISKK